MPCVISMLLWLCMSFSSALFCNRACTRVWVWASLMLNMCVGWREKLALSIACLALLFACRIVRRINAEMLDVKKCLEC